MNQRQNCSKKHILFHVFFWRHNLLAGPDFQIFSDCLWNPANGRLRLWSQWPRLMWEWTETHSTQPRWCAQKMSEMFRRQLNASRKECSLIEINFEASHGFTNHCLSMNFQGGDPKFVTIPSSTQSRTADLGTDVTLPTPGISDRLCIYIHIMSFLYNHV